MGILSRLVRKQVIILIWFFGNSLSCSVYLCMTYWHAADLEIPKVVGGILEVCAIDETSIIWCFAAGIIIFLLRVFSRTYLL